MAELLTLFPTRLYRAALDDEMLRRDLLLSCLMLAKEDRAGQAWSEEHRYKGYTSYASLNDLPQRDPAFAALRKALDAHAKAFAVSLAMELGRRRLQLDSLWVNVLSPGGAHSAHIHPNSVISGTYYVDTPPGASGLRFEDPRLGLMMAAPPRRRDAPEGEQAFVTLTPRQGEVLLWESYLRHEVLPHGGRKPRVSISFNYSC